MRPRPKPKFWPRGFNISVIIICNRQLFNTLTAECSFYRQAESVPRWQHKFDNSRSWQKVSAVCWDRLEWWYRTWYPIMIYLPAATPTNDKRSILASAAHHGNTCAVKALTLLVGQKEGHPACKSWVLVCWWWWFDWRAPCGLQGCKNGPALFPGRMSYKATKPGLVSVLYLSMFFNVLVFIRAPFYVHHCSGLSSPKWPIWCRVGC